MPILAQVDPDLLRWIQSGIAEYGLPSFVLLLAILFVIFLTWQNSKQRERESQRFDKLIEDQTKRVNKLEEQYKESQTLREKDREQFEKDRERYQEEINAVRKERDEINERLKQEIEKLHKERDENKNEIGELNNKIARLNERLTELERERVLDREEKEQIIRENQRLISDLANEKRRSKRLENELSVANQMLADYKTRVDKLEDDYKQKDMDLREAHGKIVALMENTNLDDTLPVIVPNEDSTDELKTPIIETDEKDMA